MTCSISVAQKILDWNLKRFPNGVFFLFGAGRLSLNRSRPALAISYYNRARQAQSQYRNLHHISHWEMAIANFALWEVRESLSWWRELKKDATWSKACYAYGVAVCLIDLGEDEAERVELMKSVPGLKQRIAGKSIPLEVRKDDVSRYSTYSCGRNSSHANPRSSLHRTVDSSCPPWRYRIYGWVLHTPQRKLSRPNCCP